MGLKFYGSSSVIHPGYFRVASVHLVKSIAKSKLAPQTSQEVFLALAWPFQQPHSILSIFQCCNVILRREKTVTTINDNSQIDFEIRSSKIHLLNAIPHGLDVSRSKSVFIVIRALFVTKFACCLSDQHFWICNLLPGDIVYWFSIFFITKYLRPASDVSRHWTTSCEPVYLKTVLKANQWRPVPPQIVHGLICSPFSVNTFLNVADLLHQSVRGWSVYLDNSVNTLIDRYI